MAQPFKIHAVVSGKTLTLSDLEAFDGKRVEVTVAEAEESTETAPVQRELGLLRGKMWVAEDFDAPLPDELQKYFDGKAD